MQQKSAPLPGRLFLLGSDLGFRLGGQFRQTNRFLHTDAGKVELALSLPHVANLFAHAHREVIKYVPEDTGIPGRSQERAVWYNSRRMNAMGDPYLVLYGAMLFLFGLAFAIFALLPKAEHASWPLAGVLGTLTALFLGLFAYDLARLYAADVNPQDLGYRWSLYVAAILLCDTGTLLLGTFGNHIMTPQAKEYRIAALVCLFLSAAALAGIVLQPLFA